jgi:ribosomal protein L40E
MPVLAEKRSVTGTSCLKCNALLTLAASGNELAE